MFITNPNVVDKKRTSCGKTFVYRAFLKKVSSLLEAIHTSNIWFPINKAQNKERKDIHISTGLIVITSIYI